MTVSEEYRIEKSRVRVDIHSAQPITLLTDLNFLQYRLGDVAKHSTTEKPSPDLVWLRDEEPKEASWKDRTLLLRGEWPQGELQRLLISLLVRELEEADQFVFHSSAVLYRGQSVLFLSGEENHGKTMSLIEACRRGGEVVAGESLICNGDGSIAAGSRYVFLETRVKGTERTDKPPATEGVKKFFAQLPPFRYAKTPKTIDLVTIPDIDGNFSVFVSQLSDFEREYQTFVSLSDFYVLRTILGPGIPMPLIDTEPLRTKRDNFAGRFAARPYFLIRGPDPSAVLDEVDKIIEAKAQ